MNETHKPTIMQIQTGLTKKILITTAIMSALILIVYYFNIPNPNMILIAGLVLCSALFGFGGGIVAALIMFGYTLFFFSTDNSFTRFTPQNLQKVFVSLFGITADMLFVCFLKNAEVQAFQKVDALTKELHRENKMLEQMSLTDALTGIRNRMALRQDYESYQGHEVTVMMLDLNNFKLINDTHGHEVGDRILRETGKILTDIFGEKHCYRYGGDEFLVIVPDGSEADFQAKLDTLEHSKPVIKNSVPVEFSTGYVHEMLSDLDRLRILISNADEKMYREKRIKENTKKTSPVLEKTALPEIKSSEYTVGEMKSFLNEMSGKYALARVVDPKECRILEFHDNGKISMNEKCYGIWNAGQKCINCSSSLACKTKRRQEKAEHFKDQVYFIQSNPVSLKLKDGSVYDAVVELVDVKKDSNTIANDREAENIGNRAAQYLAYHDSLTNILNADAFYELARELIKNKPDMSWVMITGNIMNFRLVNTLFGDLKGNEVLVKTASVLQEISEGSKGLCGRLGGDQFAMLLPDKTFEEEKLHNCSRTLADHFNSGNYTFCIHFGVYVIDDPSIPVSVMCGRANSALRTIREDMSLTVAYFDETILEKILLEQKVISGFEKALEDGEFRMYLQPLVKNDGCVIGAEALVRWIRPDGTLMMPDFFIETLEQAGLIQKLDMYIWELAVKQLSIWKHTDKKDLTISVNMSAKDFYSIDVYDVLTNLITKYNVDSRMLRLEITETALLVDPEKGNAIVSRLREKGFLVEIDDFGKGYSSLALLKDIQADVIKIDMSFLREINDRERSRNVLKYVIDLAASLGMDVITEGVETEQQLRILTEMGCRHFQGYYFSRPIPADEFESKYFTAG